MTKTASFPRRNLLNEIFFSILGTGQIITYLHAGRSFQTLAGAELTDRECCLCIRASSDSVQLID